MSLREKDKEDLHNGVSEYLRQNSPMPRVIVVGPDPSLIDISIEFTHQVNPFAAFIKAYGRMPITQQSGWTESIVLNSSEHFELLMPAAFKRQRHGILDLLAERMAIPGRMALPFDFYPLIQGLVDKSRDDDFSEDGYLPLSEETKDDAIIFSRSLSELPVPRLILLPEGRIGFRWNRDKNVVLVTLGNDKKIVLSSLINGSQLFGEWDFDGSLPESIRTRVGELINLR
jgi:hypothetical protein